MAISVPYPIVRMLRWGDTSQIIFAAAASILAAAISVAIALQEFALAAVIVCVPLLLLMPVQLSLGVFAFTLPFDSILLIGRGVTLAWLVGAAAGAILLVYGIMAKRLQKPPRAALWLGIFVLWTCASLVWSLDPAMSMERLPSVLSLYGLYVVAISFRIHPEERRAVVLLAIAGGSVAACYAIREFAQGTAWVGSRASLVVGGLEANPNDFASSLLLPLSLALGAFLTARTFLKAAAMLAALAVVALCIFLTMSRGSLFALGAVLLTYLYRVGMHKRILLPFSLLVTTVFFLPSQFSRRLYEGVSSRAQGRFDIWDVSIQIVKRYGLFGAGLENFHAAYNQFAGYAPIFRGFDRDPHNIYIQIFAETGIVGLVLFGVAIWSQFRPLRSFPKQQSPNYQLLAIEAGCWGLLAHGLAANLLWRKYFWLAWILLAITVRETTQEHRSGTQPEGICELEAMPFAEPLRRSSTILATGRRQHFID
jgi:O-Antigen ligase